MNDILIAITYFIGICVLIFVIIPTLYIITILLNIDDKDDNEGKHEDEIDG